MAEWISVKERLPKNPQSPEAGKEYLVTVNWSNIYEEDEATSLTYIGCGEWEDINGNDGYNVIAWAKMPEPYEDPTKYRWRFSPDGYGNLRHLYLTAAFPVLTLAEWDFPVEKNNYKNIFTNDEFKALSNYWGFDTGLFVKEEIDDMIAVKYGVPNEEKES